MKAFKMHKGESDINCRNTVQENNRSTQCLRSEISWFKNCKRKKSPRYPRNTGPSVFHSSESRKNRIAHKQPCTQVGYEIFFFTASHNFPKFNAHIARLMTNVHTTTTTTLN